MSDLDIERAWAIWPTEDPQNEEHPHRGVAVRVTEMLGAVMLEIDGDEHASCAILTPEEWRELTSLPVRFSEPEELATD
ncbi:MAG TPA: hypothetical protein VFM93_03720 [Candidatus Limnocylindria bacterium]|nr:hypothetical protein [Candidatus Limnocylindria bacterium]